MTRSLKQLQLKTQVPPTVYEEVQARAAEAGVSLAEWQRRVILGALARGAEDWRFAEVQLVSRRAEGGEVGTLFELLLARQPLVADLVRGDGHLDPGIARAIRAELSPTIAERVIAVFTGARTLEAKGKEQGVSKQAVHQSLQRAFKKLGRSRRFADALAAAFPDAGLTGALLLEAVHGQEQAQRR